MALADRLSRYFLSVKYGDLDRRTVDEMKRRVIDAVGCAIGASREAPIEMARRAVIGLRDGGGSTILGTRSRTTPELAAFVNGFMIRYFDFNDTYLSKEPAHPSDNLGACFPVAEAEGVGGRELLLAAVLAYEVQCRLCDAAEIRHRGWDHVNYGLVSTALASSKLMRLREREATQAVNMALSGHVAMRQVRAGELSMWKGAAFANAARNGVFAALLAREGITGPAPIFEGEMGFFKQVSGPFDLHLDRFGGRRGGFKVKETYVKFWPAEYHSQTAVWAALDLRGEVRDVSDVESVLVETHEAGYSILAKDGEKWRPSTKETADHSLPFIVGMALLKGTIDNSTYSGANLRNEKILDFVGKVAVEEDRRLTALYPSKGVPNRITLTLKGGKKVAREVMIPRGHPLNPMSEAEVEEKFMRLAGPLLGRRRASAALELLWQTEKCTDIGELLAPLVTKRRR